MRLSRLLPALCASLAVLFAVACDLLGGNATGDESGTTVDAGAYDPVKTILGRGYDVFGLYADPVAPLSQVLDFDRLVRDGMVEKTAIGRTVINKSSGSSTSDYQSNLGATASLSGKYGFFSGSVKASFGKDVATSSSYEFCTISASVRDSMYAIKNASDVRVLKTYLTARFAADLADASLDPKELFDIYGTHVLAGAILGGRFDYNLAAKRESSNTSTSIATYAEIKYKTKFSSAAASGGAGASP